MHVLHALKKINLTNYSYFYNKNLFNFECLHVFAWSYMLVYYNVYHRSTFIFIAKNPLMHIHATRDTS